MLLGGYTGHLLTVPDWPVWFIDMFFGIEKKHRKAEDKKPIKNSKMTLHKMKAKMTLKVDSGRSIFDFC